MAGCVTVTPSSREYQTARKDGTRTPGNQKRWVTREKGSTEDRTPDSPRKLDRRRARTRHGVSETRANKFRQRTEFIFRHKKFSAGENRTVYSSPTQLLAKEVGGAEPAGSRLQQANG
ncbi:hypothetical protein FB451DRAFT_1162828 [Mycena latifolia]|nr:hypothetical protein FB451DRAFT_1162828 [Mycena latifolia]